MHSSAARIVGFVRSIIPMLFYCTPAFLWIVMSFGALYVHAISYGTCYCTCDTPPSLLAWQYANEPLLVSLIACSSCLEQEQNPPPLLAILIFPVRPKSPQRAKARPTLNGLVQSAAGHSNRTTRWPLPLELLSSSHNPGSRELR